MRARQRVASVERVPIAIAVGALVKVEDDRIEGLGTCLGNQPGHVSHYDFHARIAEWKTRQGSKRVPIPIDNFRIELGHHDLRSACAITASPASTSVLTLVFSIASPPSKTRGRFFRPSAAQVSSESASSER